MNNDRRQRAFGRSAPVVAGPDRLSVTCPSCAKFFAIARTEEADERPQRICPVCNSQVIGRERGGAVFCSDRCRYRAYRRRKRGVPEDTYGNGGSRGSVRLNERTQAEKIAGVAAARPL